MDHGSVRKAMNVLIMFLQAWITHRQSVSVTPFCHSKIRFMCAAIVRLRGTRTRSMLLCARRNLRGSVPRVSLNCAE